MTSREPRFSLKAIARRLFILVMGIMVIFSFSQTAALASTPRTELVSNALVALAASSRFAAQAELKGQEPAVSAKRLDELREQRREWQSEVSAAADNEDKEQSDNVIDEVVNNKLNLNEITEENEIVEEIKNH